jgi:hypothetical protein
MTKLFSISSFTDGLPSYDVHNVCRLTSNEVVDEKAALVGP